MTGFHQRQQHAKEVVEELDRVVRADDIRHIVLAGDEVAIPAVRAELPSHLAEKVIDVVRLDITAPEHEVLSATLESLQEQDAREDAGRVRRAVEGYRGGGLGVAGIRDTLAALARGQVGELLVSADFETRHPEPVPRNSPYVPPEIAMQLADEVAAVDLADELVSRARGTDATVSFIENTTLLAELDGVAGLLRFTM
jgi:peptide subunit release factor 1 (eRF1)